MADLTISVDLDATGIKDGAEDSKRAVRGIGDEAEKAAKRSQSLAKVDYSSAISQLKEYGSQIQNLGSQLSGFGQQLTYGVTLPIIGLGAAAIKSFADVELAVASISTIKPEINTKVLLSQLNEMSTRVPQTAQELGDGLYQIFSSINVTQKEGLQLLESFAQGATAAQTNAETFGTAVLGVMNAYKLSVSDAGHISDVFFNTVNLGVVSGAELASSLGTVTQSAKSAGVSFDELGALIVGVTKEGGNASENINNLSNLLQKLPTKESSAAIKELGVDVKSADGNFRPVIDVLGDLKTKLDAMTPSARALALQKIFPDAQARTGALTIMSQLDAVKEALDINKTTAGAAEAAYKKIAGTASVQFSLLKNTSVAILAELGSAILPVLQPLIMWLSQTLVPAIKQVVESFKAWSPEMQRTAVVIAGIVAAIGPVLVVLGTLITFVGSVVGSISTLIPIFASVGGVIASVGGFIISFIGLIGEAGLVASFGALASVVGTSVVSAIGAFLSALAPIAVGVAAVVAVIGLAIGIAVALYQAYQTNFGGLKTLVDDAFNGVVSTVQSGLEAVQQFWTTYGGQIIDTATNTFNSIIEFIRPAMTEIVNFMRESWSAIVEVVAPIWTQIVGIVQKSIPAIKAIIQAGLSVIVEYWRLNGDTIKSNISAVWAIIKTIVTTAISLIGNTISLYLAVINGDWSQVWQSLKNIVSTVFTAIVSIIKNAGILILNALKLAFTTLGAIAIWVGQKAGEIGKAIIQGIVNGIKNGASWIANAAWDLGKSAINSIKEAVDSHSPSREAQKVGEFVTEGFAIGIESQIGKSSAAASKVAKEAIKQLSDAQKEFAKLAGASPETVATIQQTNRTSEATNAQQEIIKLRAQLGENLSIPLPSTVMQTEAELSQLKNKLDAATKSGEEFKSLMDALENAPEIDRKNVEEDNKAFEERIRNLESAGQIQLLNLQQEIDLSGVTNKLDQEKIKNGYDIRRLREQMANDGFTTDQINDEAEILRLQQNQQLELQRILEIRKQVAAASEFGKGLNEKLFDLQNGNRELTEYEKTLRRLNEDFKDISPAQKEQILNTAKQIDAQKAYNEEWKKTYDFIRGALDVLFDSSKSFGDKLKSIFGGIFQSFKKMLLDMTAAWLTNKVLGGGGSSGSGGFLDIFKGIFGGGGSTSSSGESGGLFGIIKNFMRPGSSSSGVTSNGGIQNSLVTPDGKTFSTGGFGGLFAPQKNILTGKNSQLAGIIGGVGSLVALAGGLIGGRVGGILSSAGTGAQIGAMFGPWGAAIGAGIGLIAGLFGGDPKRKRDKNEKLPELNKQFADAMAQLRALGADKNAIFSDPEGTITKAIELRGQIASGFGIKFESKKYQGESQKLITAKLVEADAIIADLNRLKDRGMKAREVDTRLQANFASGVYMDARFASQYGDFKRRNGMLSGSFTGKDTLPSMLAMGEMVLNPYQIERIKQTAGYDIFKGQGIPNYATGTYVAPTSSISTVSPNSGDSAPREKQQMLVQILVNNSGMVESDFKVVLKDSIKEDVDVQVELVKAYDKQKPRVRG